MLINIKTPAHAGFVVKESMKAATTAFVNDHIANSSLLTHEMADTLIENLGWTKAQSAYILKEVVTAFRRWKLNGERQTVVVQTGDRLFDLTIHPRGGFSIRIRFSEIGESPDWEWLDEFIPPSQEWSRETNSGFIPEFDSEPVDF